MVRDIWIVWRAEYDGSAEPTLLAAYDGEHAKQCAQALVDLLERAQASGKVGMTAVPLWPILNARDPSPHTPR